MRDEDSRSAPDRTEARGRVALAGAALAAFLVVSVARPSPLAAAPVAAKGPYLTSVTDGTATIRFELTAAAPATVDVTTASTADGGGPADAALPPGRPARFESRDPLTMHAVRVTGLQPATRYEYVVRSGGAALGQGHFVTAPASDAPLTFLVYGDDRSDDAAHAAVVGAMLRVPSSFVVNTGDMVGDGGSAPEWQRFFDIEKPLLADRPLFSAIGNHELYDDAAGSNFSRYVGFPDDAGVARPYGTVRFGAVRLFLLNGLDDWGGGPEREWLNRALDRADAEPGLAWRIAVVHEGPWAAGPHGPNPKLLAAGIPQLLAAHHVDLLFSGHDHIYERGDAGVLKYVVSGGGGAPLYRDLHPTASTRKVEAAHHFVEVTTRGDALVLVAHRIDGSILDRCGFTRGGPWDCDAPKGAQAPAPAPAAPAPPAVAASSTRSASCAVAGAIGRADAPSRGRAPAFLGLVSTAAALSVRRARRRTPPRRR